MTTKTLSYMNPERWLYVFIGLHLMVWTLIPATIRDNLPLDSIEGTIWGQQLQWGYDKNPFLNGWLTALAIRLGGQPGWFLYLFSQLSVVVCFWAIWRFAKQILSPSYALIAVLVLESVQYYNFHAIDFNDNTLELSLWALTITYFYEACRKPNRLAWLLTGFFAGLGMMAKYYTAALLLAMLLFFLAHTDTRKQLKTIQPYLGLLTFSIIVIPHIIWLCYHDFITVRYVFARAHSPASWTNHIIYPIRFAWQQLEVFLPAIILCAALCIGKGARSVQVSLQKFDMTFLIFVGLGPFVLTLLLSCVLGITLRAGWGMPLLSLWGVIAIATIQPHITTTKMRAFLITIFILMSLFVSTYILSLIDSSDESSANYPGKEIARVITQQWHATYHAPLNYVAGSRWVGGNIEFYSPDHPAVFVEWNPHRAPWVKENLMRKKGAVFVWEITGKENLPANIQQQYSALSKPMILSFSWHRNKNHLEPVKIGVAFLPPDDEYKA